MYVKFNGLPGIPNAYSMSVIDIQFPTNDDGEFDLELRDQANRMANGEISKFFESYTNCEVEVGGFNNKIDMIIRYKIF